MHFKQRNKNMFKMKKQVIFRIKIKPKKGEMLNSGYTGSFPNKESWIHHQNKRKKKKTGTRVIATNYTETYQQLVALVFVCLFVF